MAKVTRYFMKNNTSGLAKFNIDYSDAILDNQTIYINGTNKVDSIYIGIENQVTFDFTQSGNGKDNLYLVSNLANYKLYKTTIMTANDTLVLNIGSTVIKANQADKLIFADGSVNVAALIAAINVTSIDNAVTLSDENLVGWNSLVTSSSILPSADSSSAAISGFVQTGNNDTGVTFATTRKSAMVLRGSAGVDVVYVAADTQVDATELADGEDKIYLSKAASDYTISRAGNVVRLQAGNESITVLKGDRLFFINDSKNISVAHLLDQIPTGTSIVGVPLASASNTSNDAPSVSINVSDSTLTAGERATVNFSFSENIAGFDSSDISVVGGTLSGLSKLSDKIYQATYTPNDNSNTAGSISIAANKFSDLANLNNSVATSTSFTINTIRPTVSISSSASTLNSVNKTATLSLNFSAAPSGFALDDLSVVGGASVGSFTSLSSENSTSYTVKFIAANDVEVNNPVFNIRENAYTIATSPNGNRAASLTSNWVVDTRLPEINIAPARAAAGGFNNSQAQSGVATVSLESGATAVVEFARYDVGAPVTLTQQGINKVITRNPSGGFLVDGLTPQADSAYPAAQKGAADPGTSADFRIWYNSWKGIDITTPVLSTDYPSYLSSTVLIKNITGTGQLQTIALDSANLATLASDGNVYVKVKTVTDRNNNSIDLTNTFVGFSTRLDNSINTPSIQLLSTLSSSGNVFSESANADLAEMTAASLGSVSTESGATVKISAIPMALQIFPASYVNGGTVSFSISQALDGNYWWNISKDGRSGWRKVEQFNNVTSPEGSEQALTSWLNNLGSTVDYDSTVSDESKIPSQTRFATRAVTLYSGITNSDSINIPGLLSSKLGNLSGQVPDGPVIIRVEATDAAGNTSVAQEKVLIVNASTPNMIGARFVSNSLMEVSFSEPLAFNGSIANNTFTLKKSGGSSGSIASISMLNDASTSTLRVTLSGVSLTASDTWTLDLNNNTNVRDRFNNLAPALTGLGVLQNATVSTLSFAGSDDSLNANGSGTTTDRITLDADGKVQAFVTLTSAYSVPNKYTLQISSDGSHWTDMTSAGATTYSTAASSLQLNTGAGKSLSLRIANKETGFQYALPAVDANNLSYSWGAVDSNSKVKLYVDQSDPFKIDSNPLALAKNQFDIASAFTRYVGVANGSVSYSMVSGLNDGLDLSTSGYLTVSNPQASLMNSVTVVRAVNGVAEKTMSFDLYVQNRPTVANIRVYEPAAISKYDVYGNLALNQAVGYQYGRAGETVYIDIELSESVTWPSYQALSNQNLIPTFYAGGQLLENIKFIQQRDISASFIQRSGQTYLPLIHPYKTIFTFSAELPSGDSTSVVLSDLILNNLNLVGRPGVNVKDYDYQNSRDLVLQIGSGNAMNSYLNQSSVADSNRYILDNSAPVFTSANSTTSLNENTGASQLVYTATASDANPFSYLIDASSSDAALFSIDNAGRLRLNINPNYERKSVYSVTIIAQDYAGNSTKKVLSVAINNLDDTPPSFAGEAIISVSESISSNTIFASATALDSDFISPNNASSVTYGLSSDSSSLSLFSINSSTGALSLRSGITLDFESQPFYKLDIIATDAASNSSLRNILINVSDVDERVNLSADISADTTGNALMQMGMSNSIALAGDFTDPEGKALTYSITSSVLNATQINHLISATGLMGMSFDTLTGVLSGTPSADASLLDFTINSSDNVSNGADATRRYTINFTTDPVINSISVSDSVGNSNIGKAGETVMVTLNFSEAMTLNTVDAINDFSASLRIANSNINLTSGTAVYNASLLTGIQFPVVLPNGDAQRIMLTGWSISGSHLTLSNASGMAISSNASNLTINSAYILDNSSPYVGSWTDHVYIDEETEPETIIYEAIGADKNGLHYSLPSGVADNTLFSVSDHGQIYFSNPNLTDYEGSLANTYATSIGSNQKKYEISLLVQDDAGNSSVKAININLNNLSESPSGSVNILGQALINHPLRADIQTLSDSDGIIGNSFSYQWQRLVDGAWLNIAGATSSVYFPGSSDMDYRLRVAVRYQDSFPSEQQLFSAPSNVISLGPVLGYQVNKPFVPSGQAQTEGADALNTQNQISLAGDVNGDGLADMVVATNHYGVDKQISVVFGKADGTRINLNNAPGVGSWQGLQITLPSFALSPSPYTVSGVGDINNDGLEDILIGLPENQARLDSILAPAGICFLLYGRSTSASIDLSNPNTLLQANNSNGFVILGACSITVDIADKIGTRLARVGDVNGDGLDDMVIGAKNAGNFNSDASGLSVGQVYVVFGKTDNQQVDLRNIVTANGEGTGGYVIKGYNSGNSGISYIQKQFQIGDIIRPLGDINADGLQDLGLVSQYAVNDSLQSFNSADPGSVAYIVYGKRDTHEIQLSSFHSAINSNTSGFLIYSSATFNYTAGGQSTSKPAEVISDISVLGDMNGDGYSDFIVSSCVVSSVDFHAMGSMKNYLIFNPANSGLAKLDLNTLSASQGYQIIDEPNHLSNSQQADTFIGIGDVNGDGLSDMLLATDNNYTVDGVNNVSKAYVIFGKTASGDIQLSNVASGTGGFVIVAGASNANDPIGELSIRDLSGAGDVNGDGLADLMLSTKTNHSSFVIFGKTDTDAVYLNQILLARGEFLIPDIMGSTADDTLTGNSTNQVILGNAGNDVMIGNGGRDVMLGGAGNDTFVINSSNISALSSGPVKAANSNISELARIDGGNGIDTLKLESGTSLNFANIPMLHHLNASFANRISSIEKIQMAPNGASSLAISAQDVLDISSINLFNTGNGWSNSAGNALASSVSKYQLVVMGDNNDQVDLDLAQWSKVMANGDNPAIVMNAASNYEVWNHNSSLAQLIIQQNVTVI